MDKLLSSFTSMYIDSLNDSELLLLCDLLDIDDENLYKFNQGQKTSIKIHLNDVTKLFKNYIYRAK